MENKPKRKKKTSPFLKFGITIVIILLAIVFLLKQPLFNVTKIQVIGNEELRTSDIINETGITNGTNIFTLSRKNVVDRLLKMPYVKNVNVKKRFPNKVIIEVLERENTAAFRMQEQYYLIDDDGILLEIVPEQVPDITIIGGLDIQGLKPGDRTFTKMPDKKVEDLLRQLQSEDLFHSMYVIMLEDLDHATMEMFSGINIEFGSLNEVKYKVTFLKEILEDVHVKGINVKSILMDQGTKPIIVTDD